ncbi:MAG: hypothetical protein VR68_10655 [Peptococcaceae bacterium BRH_c4a]|nr:MAG: hypothetical protein VR68_10655 [Peptococcaceae bacterium BRH_c4a]
MYGMNMSEMEKLQIQALLKAEELCARKVQRYMSQSGDPAVQGVLQQAMDRGNRHISALNGLMQEAGFTGASGH